MENKTLETTIPFSGFYHSVHSELLEYTISYMIFTNDNGNPYESLAALADDEANWGQIWKDYAKAYAENFAYAFRIPTLQFEELVSPREYNFTTDRIFCKIGLEDVQKMFELVGKKDLQKVIEERFTSRSGFISFYDNQLESWPENLADWDPNQVGTLLICYTNRLNEQELSGHETFENLDEIDVVFGDSSHDITYNIVTNNITNERVWKIYDYLRAREERERSKQSNG